MKSVFSQLSSITALSKKKGKEVFIASGIIVGNQIITASPVDKGSFINNWNTTVDGIGYNTSQADDKSGAGAQDELVAAFGSAELGSFVTFNNPMPYGARLEYDGWSEKAPNGFVRINTAKWGAIVQEEILKRR